MLERYAEPLAGTVTRDGYLIISGFMDSETTVVPALEKFLSKQRVDAEDEWRCAVFSR